MIYKILQAKRGGFLLRGSDGTERFCPARGKMRTDGLHAGDDVELDGSGGIVKIGPRKNLLIRPPLANVAACAIVLSPAPAPDFHLVDKLLIQCFRNQIEPILCVNKSDAAGAESLFERARKNYAAAVARILLVSAADGTGAEELRAALPETGITCLAGQSAVGKSSLLNRLLPDLHLEVGELSAKIERGKNTTRACRLYPIGSCREGVVPDNRYIADTAGFSLLDAGEFFFEELKYFYPEFAVLAGECKMRGCNHIDEPGCAVVKWVTGKGNAQFKETGICRERWERYVEIFRELEEFHKNRYK
ncbi:putative ribosome biogenesis GTPase RsgA [Clostridia bacterium]|nr:putative ribosome biogenesis GTPase RsgA [Clostridia bacterium]